MRVKVEKGREKLKQALQIKPLGLLGQQAVALITYH
jgi:hypothetical protein